MHAPRRPAVKRRCAVTRRPRDTFATHSRDRQVLAAWEKSGRATLASRPGWIVVHARSVDDRSPSTGCDRRPHDLRLSRNPKHPPIGTPIARRLDSSPVPAKPPRFVTNVTSPRRRFSTAALAKTSSLFSNAPGPRALPSRPSSSGRSVRISSAACSRRASCASTATPAATIGSAPSRARGVDSLHEQDSGFESLEGSGGQINAATRPRGFSRPVAQKGKNSQASIGRLVSFLVAAPLRARAGGSCRTREGFECADPR
jgi:hypothetical protein